tara:strand:- start:67 stop:267 length:201 start_codon:yes stop_codon:yes gene_type:complete
MKKEKSLLIKQLSNINKNLMTHNQMMSVFLKFALDSSSYKSKTINDAFKASEKQNEILKAIHKSNF